MGLILTKNKKRKTYLRNSKKMSSAKNILQEYFQKNKLPLPTYETTQTNENKYPPLFESTLVFNKISFHGYGKSKVNAEKEVAQMVCDNLESLSLNEEKIPLAQKYCDIEHIPIQNHQKKIYLIDGDNCHIEDETCFSNRDSLYIYFIAKNNTQPMCRIHQQNYVNCCLFITSSISKDSVDHFITYCFGKMSICGKTKNI